VEDPATRTDNELVAASLSGDASAFGLLVVRYRRLAIGVAYRMCGDAALAEDIAQDTFVRVWDRLHTYRPQGSFRGWMCRIATNLTIDALRRQRPTVDVEKVSLEATSGRPEANALRDERAHAVRSAIAGLPEQTRAALVLREYEGLSYQEIADVLDVPIGTVKSRLNDARRRLRVALASYMEE
jgi:RNA polymerase sigma-70 factor (ECF subfamily)